MLERIRASPRSFQDQFIFTSIKLSAASLINDRFVPENDKLAEEGSNMRSDQNRSIAYWRDFVLDVECKYGVLVLPNEHA